MSMNIPTSPNEAAKIVRDESKTTKEEPKSSNKKAIHEEEKVNT